MDNREELRSLILANQLAKSGKEIERLREFIRYWSYCTRQGLQWYCPEKYQEWLEDMRKLCPAGVVELGVLEMMQAAKE